MWYKFAPSGGAASSAASPAASPAASLPRCLPRCLPRALSSPPSLAAFPAASPAPSPAASLAGCLPRRPGAEREPLPGALALGPGVPGARGALPEEGFNLGTDGRRFAGRPGLFSPGLAPWALRRLKALVVQVAPLPPHAVHSQNSSLRIGCLSCTEGVQ